MTLLVHLPFLSKSLCFHAGVLTQFRDSPSVSTSLTRPFSDHNVTYHRKDILLQSKPMHQLSNQPMRQRYHYPYYEYQLAITIQLNPLRRLLRS